MRDWHGGGSGEGEADGGLNNAYGSTGNTYEALFETDATDTIFRGEKGIAEWQRPLVGEPSISSIPNTKGLGSMADLAVQAASDFALAETVLNATNAMGLDANDRPSLKQLRADATPVFGAWSQSMELTRELVPVLLNKAVDVDGRLRTMRITMTVTIILILPPSLHLMRLVAWAAA